MTIPLEIRKKLQITPATEVEFIVDDNGRFYIEKKEPSPKSNRFSNLRGIATVKMSTEEIMALTRAIC